MLTKYLNINTSLKNTHFVRFYDTFNIPLMTFEDIPKFLPNTEQKYNNIIKHNTKLLYTYTKTTIPKITIITHKTYNKTYYIIKSKHLHTNINYTYPTTEITIMGPKNTINILYHQKLTTTKNETKTFHKQKVNKFHTHFTNPYTTTKKN